MCSYITETTPVAGSGKGVPQWLPLQQAHVYYDHPTNAPFEHALIIDFVNQDRGPGARVAVELSPDSARALVEKILAALKTGEDQ